MERTAERTNAERADKAYRVALGYHYGDSDIGEVLVDLIADLLHLADQYGGARDAHRIAWDHYVAETSDVQDFDPQKLDPQFIDTDES
jgi:hypothetical protein